MKSLKERTLARLQGLERRPNTDSLLLAQEQRERIIILRGDETGDAVISIREHWNMLETAVCVRKPVDRAALGKAREV
jgi:hypothetical protein